jgi:hypothetical protein
MAQTTNSVWGGAAKVEFSTNGSDWTDFSGHSQNVTPDAVTRRIGEKWTFDGEYPIVKVGKRNSIGIMVGVIYTEEATDAFEVVRAQFEADGGGTLYLRWSPAGGSGGDFQYTTDAGFVKEFNYAPVDSEEDGPMTVEFGMQCAQITKSTVAT